MVREFHLPAGGVIGVKAVRHHGEEFGLPHLGQAFHSGWRDEFSTPGECLAAYVRQQPVHFSEALLADALRVSAASLAEWSFEALWESSTRRSMSLRREGTTGRDWLHRIIDTSSSRCDDKRADHPEIPAECPYMPLAGAVLDEISIIAPLILEQVETSSIYVTSGIVTALSSCAAGVSPDLAFRYLLLALPHNISITRSQFDRYVHLGRMFDYGSWVVGRHEHLVQ
ncbi:hypothetical protein [Kitasatospora sp. NPDC088346]|uniref:hypothetical protein n=1 Tax=Kitasatospora sp. NPDC088346 TaxID=3364073 RepID=UPI003812DF84